MNDHLNTAKTAPPAIFDGPCRKDPLEKRVLPMSHTCWTFSLVALRRVWDALEKYGLERKEYAK